MDKKLMGALGAASALALLAAGQASAATGEMEAPGLQPAQSFGELLDPIPNALTTLTAEDQKTISDEAPIQVAQDHHHHHHHHHHHRRRHHHHHHHYY